MINPSTLTQVYGPTVRPATSASVGWVYYEFDTPFEWDGGSNIVLSTFMNQSGSSQSSSGFYAYSTNSSRSGASVYRYKDSNPFTLTDWNSGNSGSASTYRPSISFIVEPCNATGTCAPPFVVLDSVGETEIDIVWTPGNTESSWDLDIQAEGDTGWTYVSSVTDPYYNFINLTGNTPYRIRVTSNCSDTVRSTIVSTRTTCSLEALPFTENFESWSSGSSSPSMSCWYRFSNYSSGYPYITTGTSHNGGNKSMYMYSGSGSYSYLTLPLMASSIDSLQVSFWLYTTYSGYSHAIEVGVMEDPEDISTFTLIEDVMPTTTYNWEPFEIPLNSYTGNGRYITLKTRTAETSYPYLDDIEVTYISPCPRVRNVTSRNTTLTDATIAWDTTSAYEYEIEYGPAGFARGTGTIIPNIYDDSVDITGLNHSTQYEVYVRGICNPDTGNWSFSYKFWSECAMIDSLPYGSNFDEITNSNDHSPHCWYGTSTYDSYYPELDSYEDRYGNGNSFYMYLYDPGSSYTIMQLPPVDTNVLPIRTLQLEFSLMNSYGTGGMIVGVCTGRGLVGFTPIDTVLVNEDYMWHDFEVPMGTYSDTGYYITLKQYCPAGGDLDLYLDEVRLVTAPECLRPRTIRASSVTLTDATLRWDLSDSTQTEFELRYGYAGCIPDTLTGTFVTGADSLWLTGLDSGVVYSVFIRSICGPGDTSWWTEGSFRTLASSPVTSFPYICNFTGAVGQAWNLENGSEPSQWYVGTFAHYGTSDNMGLYITTSNGTNNNYNGSSVCHTYAYRTFTFNPGSYNFSFNWHAEGEGGSTYAYDYLRAFIAPASDQFSPGSCPDGTSSSYNFWNVTPAGWISLDNSTPLRGNSTWQTAGGDFNITTAGNYNLIFYWGNDGSVENNPAAAVDNVEIFLNTCPVPQGIHASSVGVTYVDLDWTDVNSPVAWQVEYGPSGFTRGTGTLLNATSHPVHISGLDTLSAYDF